ncbi:MAG: Ig-like domain-containing protein [Pleurocapsa sp. SU_196_0]|nr:Ig-like domain-containing protein [Pleurocapsa sp. SU_196_0]
MFKQPGRYQINGVFAMLIFVLNACTEQKPLAGVLASITITPSSTAVAVGAATTLTAISKDSSGIVLATQPSLTWISSDTSIATVANGVVTGVTNGSSTITAKSGSITGVATIKVVPVVPPPSSSGARQFTLTSPSTGALPFTVGFPFRQGDIPSGQLVSTSLPNTQVIIKNVWADGSAKFGIVSGRAALTAGTPTTVSLSATPTSLSGAALTTTDLQNTGVTATTNAGTFGAVTWAGSDWLSPFQTWVSASEMSSWIYRKPVGGDAHLVAWLEVRLYAGGAVEVLPWIENGYVLSANPTNKSATYSFTLGGTQRFSAAIDLKGHQRTPLVSGSQLSHWFGSDPDINVRHDVAYLQSTSLVPSYAATVSPSAKIVMELPTSYAPLQQGSYPSGMGNPGYHGSIGLLPEWDVLYLTSTASSIWSAVQRNAYSAGRYGIHFRDENTNRPIRFSSYPNLVLDGSSGVVATGASTTNSYTPAQTGGPAPNYTSSHGPQLGYFAYLLTGRLYHLETAQFQATIHFLKNNNTSRKGIEGVLQTNVGANTTRGAAWSMRSLALAAAITPDGDGLQSELLASVEANINFYHGKYVAQANNPLGWVAPYSDYTQPVMTTTLAGSTTTNIIFPSGYVFTTDDYYNGWEIAIGGQTRAVVDYIGTTRTAVVSPAFTVTTAVAPVELRSDNVYFEATWMQDFFTAVFGFTKSVGLPISAATRAKLEAFFAWKAKSIVGRFGGTDPTEYLYRDAATYTIAIAPSNIPDYDGGTGPWFANWGELYNATYTTSPGPRVDGALRGAYFPDCSSYWGNLQPALAYAVEHNISGATTAHARMTGAPNWQSFGESCNIAPVWSVRPKK